MTRRNVSFLMCVLVVSMWTASYGGIQVDTMPVLDDDITYTSAILRGRISGNAGDASGWYQFRYFKTVDGLPSSKLTKRMPLTTVNGKGEFSELVEGLEPNCAYRCQARAGNAAEQDIGPYVDFTTEPFSRLDLLYVDDDAIQDPGPNDLAVSDPDEDGSADHPFDSIQEAIDAAKDDATVLVREGRYRECLNFTGRPVNVNSFDSNNPLMTSFPIIDADDQGVVATFDQGEDASCLLSGFVLTRGNGDQAGAIACIGSSPTIRNCLIAGNRSNKAPIYCVDSDSLFDNCTIADNYGGEDGSGISVTGCNIVLSNSIVWGNAPQQIQVVSGNNPVILNTCTDTDPLFASPGYWTDLADPNLVPIEPDNPSASWLEGDYHLLSLRGRYDPDVSDWVYDSDTSDSIDLGDPNQSIGQETYPHGGQINAGAYGGTWMASRSHGTLKVLVCGAHSNLLDVQQKLQGTGQFSTVDTMRAQDVTPTLEELQAYDAVLVYYNNPYHSQTALGNVMADYVDGGGGVVCMMFEIINYDSWMMDGRWSSEEYYAIPRSGKEEGPRTTLGAVHVPEHPIMQGVSVFDGGSSSYRPETFDVTADAVRIADWSDGRPLVVTKMIGDVRRVDLGFYPPSSDIRSDYWGSSTDGALLMANALTWVANPAQAQ